MHISLSLSNLPSYPLSSPYLADFGFVIAPPLHQGPNTVVTLARSITCTLVGTRGYLVPEFIEELNLTFTAIE